jgi:hypothetical protein
LATSARQKLACGRTLAYPRGCAVGGGQEGHSSCAINCGFTPSLGSFLSDAATAPNQPAALCKGALVWEIAAMRIDVTMMNGRFTRGG